MRNYYYSETSHNIFNFNYKRQCEIDNTREALKEQFIIEWKHHMTPSYIILMTSLVIYTGFTNHYQ